MDDDCGSVADKKPAKQTKPTREQIADYLKQHATLDTVLEWLNRSSSKIELQLTRDDGSVETCRDIEVSLEEGGTLLRVKHNKPNSAPALCSKRKAA